MSRKLTTYRQPSITTLIATAPDILALDAMRGEIARSFAAGAIHVSEGTRRRWLVALWTRVIELMRLEPADATWVYNTVLGWPRPADFDAFFEEEYRAIVREVPSEAEALRRAGVVIVGVTE